MNTPAPGTARRALILAQFIAVGFLVDEEVVFPALAAPLIYFGTKFRSYASKAGCRENLVRVGSGVHRRINGQFASEATLQIDERLNLIES